MPLRRRYGEPAEPDVVRCGSERARDFYRHNAQLTESPTDSLHLVLLIKDLRKTLDKRGTAKASASAAREALDVVPSLTSPRHPSQPRACQARTT